MREMIIVLIFGIVASLLGLNILSGRVADLKKDMAKARQVNLLILTYTGLQLPEIVFDKLLDDIVAIQSIRKSDIEKLKSLRKIRIKKGDFLGRVEN